MKILVLTQFYPPEIAAGGLRMADMIRIWREQGHEVTVVTAVPNYPTGVVWPEYRRRFLVDERDPSGARVLRCWIVPGENGRNVSRVASFLSFAVSSLVVSLLRAGPADVVIASSPPLTVAAAGRIVALLKRARFVFDVRDLWPDALKSLGVLAGWPLRLCEGLESWLYRAADRVIVVSPAFVAHVAARRPDGDRVIHLVSNGVDLDLFASRTGADRDAVRTWLDIPRDATLLMYVGTFGMVHELESVLPALDRLRSKNVYAAFVGDGAGRDILLSEAHRLRLDNVRFPGLQAHERAPALYAAADIGLSVVRESAATDKVIASKILEIMAAGRPLLAVGGQEIRRIVEEAGCGAWVAVGDAEGFIRSVTELAGGQGNGHFGRAGREYAASHYDRRRLAARYGRIMNELCGT
ncbi:glycosyltransferase family 4 protein [soil metagenome]